VQEAPPWREVSAGHNYLCHIEVPELRAVQQERLRSLDQA